MEYEEPSVTEQDLLADALNALINVHLAVAGKVNALAETFPDNAENYDNIVKLLEQSLTLMYENSAPITAVMAASPKHRNIFGIEVQ